jgi:hypothetical protein
VARSEALAGTFEKIQELWMPVPLEMLKQSSVQNQYETKLNLTNSSERNE